MGGLLWAWFAAGAGASDAMDPVEATLDLAYRGWRLVSLADGARCSFRPTCSAYARRAISRDGLLGVPLVFDRLDRELVASGYPLAADHVHRLDPLGDHVRIVDLVRGCRAERRAGAGACRR